MTQTAAQKRAERDRWRKLGFRFVTVRIHALDWARLSRWVKAKNAMREGRKL